MTERRDPKWRSPDQERAGLDAAEHSSPRLARLRAWLGLERNVVVMLATILILGMGEELWIRFIPKYLELLGASVWTIGAYGTLKDLLDALYPYPGGWLTDRLGRRASLMLFALLGVVGYLLYLVSPSWEWVLFGTIFAMAWSSLTQPAVFAIIGDSLPQTRRAMGFGVQSILKRLPIIVAPPLGALLIAQLGLRTGIRIGLLITIVLAVIAIIITRRSYVERPAAKPDLSGLADIWRGMDGHLKRLLFAECLVRWAGGIPKVFLILYVTNVLGGGLVDFGWLTSVQMLTSTLIYLPIARLSDGMSRKPFVLVTFVMFALFPLLVAQADSLFWMLPAFVVAGLREIGEPARKAQIVDLSYATARGRAVGLYYLVRGLVVFPASLAGSLLWVVSPQLPFYVASGIGVAGCLVYARWGHDGGPPAHASQGRG